MYSWVRGAFDERQYTCCTRFKKLNGADLVILRNASVNAFITVLMLLYLVLISTALDIFNCTEDNRLISRKDILCYSSTSR